MEARPPLFPSKEKGESFTRTYNWKSSSHLSLQAASSSSSLLLPPPPQRRRLLLCPSLRSCFRQWKRNSLADALWNRLFQVLLAQSGEVVHSSGHQCSVRRDVCRRLRSLADGFRGNASGQGSSVVGSDVVQAAVAIHYMVVAAVAARVVLDSRRHRRFWRRFLSIILPKVNLIGVCCLFITLNFWQFQPGLGLFSLSLSHLFQGRGLRRQRRPHSGQHIAVIVIVCIIIIFTLSPDCSTSPSLISMRTSGSQPHLPHLIGRLRHRARIPLLLHLGRVVLLLAGMSVGMVGWYCSCTVCRGVYDVKRKGKNVPSPPSLLLLLLNSVPCQ